MGISIIMQCRSGCQ